MPDPLDHDAFGGASKFLEACVTSLALGPPELHLDEFVIVEGALRFGDDGGCHAVLAHEEDGIQWVAEAAQILSLSFGEFHGARL